MKNDEVSERRMKKAGKVTAKACIDSLVKNLDRIDAIVAVVRLKDGTIQTVWSDIYSTDAIGLLECGKDDLMVEMRT